jgi:putative FmdB family regulatory protein
MEVVPMPIYEYECKKCGSRVEVLQKMNDQPLRRCRACGGQLERLLSSVGIQFKGTGWYVTDYTRKGNGGKSDASKSKDTAKETSSEPKAEATS